LGWESWPKSGIVYVSRSPVDIRLKEGGSRYKGEPAQVDVNFEVFQVTDSITST